MEHAFVTAKPSFESSEDPTEDDSTAETEAQSCQTSVHQTISDTNGSSDGDCSCNVPTQPAVVGPELGINDQKAKVKVKTYKYKTGQPSNAYKRKGSGKLNMQPVVGAAGAAEKSKDASIVSRINSRMGRVEAWR